MLPPAVLRRIRHLHLRARRAVRSALGGDYHSAFKGTGIVVDDVREYQPGDDIRSIDWNVTARTGTAFVKRYIEERELTVLLVVDLSASLNFGTGESPKRVVAAELAALIAVAAVGHNDRVGLLAVTDRVERHVLPSKGTRHVLRLLRDVLFVTPVGRRSGLTLAFDHLNKVHRRRAIVFVMSDFLDDGYETAFRRAASRHDLIAVRISDPREQTWPAIGLVTLEDAESGTQMLVDTSDRRFREQFIAMAEKRRTDFRSLCSSAGVDLVDASTDGGHFDALLAFFRRRERRRRL